MKNLSFIFFATLLTTGAAFGGDYALPTNSLGLRTLKTANVVVPVPDMSHCPKGAMCDPAAIVELHFTLGGCLNQVGPVTYVYQQAPDGIYDVDVHAIEVVNSKSENVRCLRAPTATATISLGMGFISAERVRIHFLESEASVVQL